MYAFHRVQAGGRVWNLLGSSINSKLEKCLKIAADSHLPACPWARCVKRFLIVPNMLLELTIFIFEKSEAILLITKCYKPHDFQQKYYSNPKKGSNAWPQCW